MRNLLIFNKIFRLKFKFFYRFIDFKWYLFIISELVYVVNLLLKLN